MSRFGLDWHQPTVPREVPGGIRARSRQGEFGASWWARRWQAVLEACHMGARLDRGQSYARGGQVIDLEVNKGEVTARVQGTRPQPYEVSLVVDLLTPADRARLAARLREQALFTARLLAGEMPPEIETVFQAAGLELFPNPDRDLSTSCSCPDTANPCKHIAAVYLLLGEVFDSDPFLLFRLRGLDRNQLVALLIDEPTTPPAPSVPEELPMEAVAFWGGPPPDNVVGEVIPPAQAAPVLHRLGGFPFWRGQTPMVETLAPLLSAASVRAMEVLTGGQEVNTPQKNDPCRHPT
jgi:uncharacterized Zn finger protein